MTGYCTGYARPDCLLLGSGQSTDRAIEVLCCERARSGCLAGSCGGRASQPAGMRDLCPGAMRARWCLLTLCAHRPFACVGACWPCTARVGACWPYARVGALRARVDACSSPALVLAALRVRVGSCARVVACRRVSASAGLARASVPDGPPCACRPCTCWPRVRAGVCALGACGVRPLVPARAAAKRWGLSTR